MRVSEAFPSAFLKAEDLQGRQVVVSIASATVEEVGQGRDKETKLVLSFHGKAKKLICNKTNANTIAKLYGDDTEQWINQRITLSPREVEFQGEMVWAIRVSLQAPGAPAAAPAPAAPRPAPAPAHRPAPAPQSAQHVPEHQHQPADNDGAGDSSDVPF